MSRAAELAAERWYAQQEIDDAKNFVVGATVYRAVFDRIEEGVVKVVSRTNEVGTFGYENPNGKYPFYVAAFRSDYVSQTYSWRWFATRKEALKDLVRILSGRVQDDTHKLGKLQELLAKTKQDFEEAE